MKNLKNTYYIIRHGESKANKEGIIISSPENGTKSYGLTDLGKEQVKKSITENKHLFDNESLIISSDFLRAKETAEIIKEELELAEVIFNALLRERTFGELEKAHHSHYNKVWETDRNNPDNKEWGMESPREVLNRGKQLISKLEDEFVQKTIILVGHGDPLQILRVGVKQKCPSSHMDEEGLHNAQLIRIN